jgi:predicted RNA-binding Zn-ribbon protein involved in translation (DUF1610 family)
MNQTTPKSRSHLIDAYNQMMHFIRSAFEGTSSADMTLQEALDKARQQVIHLGEVSAEEAQEISEFVKRDINDAAEYMLETSSDFGDWLMLDIEVLERKIVDMFLSVADRTRIELEALKEYNREISLYYSGEIAGPGMLKCTQCGECVPFLTTAHIENCPRCGNNSFQRADKRTDCKDD